MCCRAEPGSQNGHFWLAGPVFRTVRVSGGNCRSGTNAMAQIVYPAILFLTLMELGQSLAGRYLHTAGTSRMPFFSLCFVPTGSPSRGGDVAFYVFDI